MMYPIPIPGGVPPWVSVLFAIAAAGGFVVLVMQAVRYFRRSKDDDER